MWCGGFSLYHCGRKCRECWGIDRIDQTVPTLPSRKLFCSTLWLRRALDPPLEYFHEQGYFPRSQIGGVVIAPRVRRSRHRHRKPLNMTSICIFPLLGGGRTCLRDSPNRVCTEQEHWPRIYHLPSSYATVLPCNGLQSVVQRLSWTRVRTPTLSPGILLSSRGRYFGDVLELLFLLFF